MSYNWHGVDDNKNWMEKLREKLDEERRERAELMGVTFEFLNYLDDIKGQLDRIEEKLNRVERQQN